MTKKKLPVKTIIIGVSIAAIITSLVVIFVKCNKPKIKQKAFISTPVSQIPSPSPQDFSNWKQHNDTELNISFKYPADYQVKFYGADPQIEGKLHGFTHIEPWDTPPNSAYIPLLEISYWENPEQLSMSQYKETYVGAEFKTPSADAEKILIDGKLTLAEYNQPCGVVKCDLYTIPYNNRFYQITANFAKIEKLFVVPDPENLEKKKQDVRDILSTLTINK